MKIERTKKPFNMIFATCWRRLKSLGFIGPKKDYHHDLPVKMHSPLSGFCIPLPLPHLSETILYSFVLVSRLDEDRKKEKILLFVFLPLLGGGSKPQVYRAKERLPP